MAKTKKLSEIITHEVKYGKHKAQAYKIKGKDGKFQHYWRLVSRNGKKVAMCAEGKGFTRNRGLRDNVKSTINGIVVLNALLSEL